MENEKSEIIFIVSQQDYKYLIERIRNGPEFAESFKFDDELFLNLLQYLEIDREEYFEKYYFFDKKRNLHISTSELDYVWISTMGLVAKGKSSSNKYVVSFYNQYTIINLLFDKAIELSEREDIYDVDGYQFGYLSDFTPALFHNILFYFELFIKAYLSLCDAKVPYTHELSRLSKLAKETMYKKNQNDSLFQFYIIGELNKIVEYINRIPGDFKEQYVKYNDNSNDGTVILFDEQVLKSIKYVIDMSNDMISDLLYDFEDSIYLNSGLFQRLLDRAETDEDRCRIIEMYGHLTK